jgi:hypothetical protein
MNVFVFCVNDNGGNFFHLWKFLFQNFSSVCGYLLWGVSFHYLIFTAVSSIFVWGSDWNRISVLEVINSFLCVCCFKHEAYISEVCQDYGRLGCDTQLSHSLNLTLSCPRIVFVE